MRDSILPGDLCDFFQRHDPSILFGKPQPTIDDLVDSFISAMEVEEIQGMLTEEYGEALDLSVLMETIVEDEGEQDEQGEQSKAKKNIAFLGVS
jgi:hypothetical protein